MSGSSSTSLPSASMPVELLGHAFEGSQKVLRRFSIDDVAAVLGSGGGGGSGTNSEVLEALDTLGRQSVARQAQRPGDSPYLFTRDTAGGDAINNAPLAPSEVGFDDDGDIVRVAGADLIATRYMLSLEPGRNYRTRFVFRRRVNPVDPSGDTVQIGVFWYDQARNALAGASQFTIIENVPNVTTGSGRVTREKTISRDGGSGVLVPPAGARYARPYIQTFGATPQTDFEVIGIQDVTDLNLYAPDVSVFDSRVTALETIDAGDRLDLLESEVSTPLRRGFNTRSDAAAATIAPSIDTLETLGSTSIGDGGARHYKRAASEPVSSDKFQSADGAWWQVFDDGHYLKSEVFTKSEVGVQIAAKVFNGTQRVIAANYPIATDDIGATINVTGINITISFGAAVSYADTHYNYVANRTNRVCYVANSSAEFTQFKLYPGQVCIVAKMNGTWLIDRPGRYVTDFAGFTIYADENTGNDANDGLAVGSPVTIQKAIRILEFEIDCAGNGPTIKVADGNFNASSIVHTFRLVGYHVIYMVGNSGNQTACVWNVPAGQIGLQCRDYSGIILDGVTMTTDGSGSTGVRASQTGIIDIWNVGWGAFSGGYHMHSNAGGSIGFVNGGSGRIAGGANAHCYSTGGDFQLVGYNEYLEAGLQFTLGYIYAQGGGGRTEVSGLTFTGNPTTSLDATYQVYAADNAWVQMGGTVLPGIAKASGGIAAIRGGSVTSMPGGGGSLYSSGAQVQSS